jgi:hypothetical protein
MLRYSAFRPRVESLDARWLPSAMTPATLAQAYGVNSVTITGTGQTIAIVDAYHDPYLANDLANFDRTFNLPGQSAPQLTSVLTQDNLAGSQTNDGWAGEEALDAEWVHATAPGAKIVVVEAKSDSLGDLMAAVNTARNLPGVSVVSMSWGGSEFPGETAYDSYFTTPTGHTPITFVAASGDSGAWYGAEWPASSPNVVAVGGTTLYTNSAGQNVFEMGWGGSGGGFSAFESEPSYQTSVQNTGIRTTPDVALNADPSTGYYTYTTAPSTGQGSWQLVGGTSASTQVFAGILGIADQVRAIFGKGTLSTTATLSTMYQTPGAFKDITWGSNGYWAGPGYDLVTGLGSPHAYQLFVALYGPGNVTGSSSSSASTSSQSSGTGTHHVVVSTPSTAATASTPTPASAPVTVIAPTGPGTQTTISPPALTVPSSPAIEAPLTAASPVSQGGDLGSSPTRVYLGADEVPVDTAPSAPNGTDAEPIRPATSDGAPAAPGPLMNLPLPDGNNDAVGSPPLTPAPPVPSPPSVPGNEDGENTPQASCVGLAVVAAATTVWRVRLRPRSQTPRGPRSLGFRSDPEER